MGANLPGKRAATGARPRARGRVFPGLAWAFRFDPAGAAEELTIDGPIAERLDGWLWLHFDRIDPQAAQSLRTISGLSPAAVELLIAAEDQQQLHADETCVYGVLADVVSSLGKPYEEIGFLHYAMTEKALVSSRRGGLSAVDALYKELIEGRRIAAAVPLLGAIAEHVVEAVEDYAEDLARELDAIEDKILSDKVSDERTVLGRIRRTTVRLHRQLTMSRSLLNRFVYDVSGSSIPFSLPTDRLGQRLDWLDSEVIALRDRAHLLQEEVTLKLAEHANRHLEVLSIVATVFLPATLVAESSA